MRPTHDFKQTEIGTIPSDWEARPLLKCVRIANGQVDPRIEPYRSMTLVAPDHIEGETGRLLAKETAGRQRAVSGKYIFDNGDIIYSKIRPYLRKATLVDFSGLCSADMYPLKPAPDVAAGFILGVLLGHRFSKYAESVSVRSGMPKINRQELADFSVALPPLAEQRAIAAALKDTDALLDTIDQLITKKGDIKQAAMQQLLTGKTRLPGFCGIWAISSVGREFDIQLGKMLDAGGNVGTPKPYIGNKSVQWNRFDLNEIKTVPMSNGDLDRYRLRKGDLVVCEGGEVGRAAIWDDPISECYYQKALHRLRPTRGYNTQFMLYLLKYRIDHNLLGEYVSQTSIAHLTREKFASVPLPVPTSPEQQAIAAVLSDMDAELTALEQRRDKTRLLKQGMMQELLTGRTRLV